MVRETPGNNTQETCRAFLRGNCRFGTNCRYLHVIKPQPASITSVQENDDGRKQELKVDPEQSATLPSTSLPATAVLRVSAIQRIDKPCRLWQAGNCKWGDRCRFQHEVKDTSPLGRSGPTTPSDGSSSAQSLSPSHTVNGAQSPAASTQPRNKRRRKAKGKATSSTLPTPTIPSHDVALHRIQEQANIARAAREKQDTLIKQQGEADRLLREREEAARLAREQEEAARQAREQEAAARQAREQEAAARRERQLQLAREREEARERERIAQRQRQKEEWAKEAAVAIQKVVLNSFVKFEPGLAIQHVICGFEASQVLIKNLPINARRSEIIELFTQQGVDEEDIAILRTEIVDGRQRATILGKAIEVETVALGLDGIDFREENLEFVVCERSSEGRTMGSSTRNSYHLNISWPPPFLSMVARYPHLEIWEIAEKARTLNGQLLNGRRITAKFEEEPRLNFGYGYDSDNDYLPPNRVINITRIPIGTSVAEVRAFADTPRVELSTDSCTSNDILTALTSHICNLPNSTLRTLALENTSRPNSVSAKAIFETWEGAKLTYDSLSGKILRHNFPPLRFFLPDPYRFTITLDEKQYNAQVAQWNELSGSGRNKETNIQTKTVDRPGGRKVFINLFGQDKKMVGALKVRIESMAAGQKLDATYWHPSFKSPKGQTFLNSLYDSTGAYARSDWKHNCIMLSGRAEAVEAAKTRLREEVERISAEEWTIPLQRRALGFFIREGLAKMKGLLGEENITLDVRSAKIVLHGADLDEARHHLRQLMDAFANQDTTSTATSDDMLCPICYDAVSQPIEISCEHIYCSSCLRHYMLSTLDNHDFPLKCMGDEARCNKPLSLPLIQKFLPPQRFEQLLELAFTSYIDKNPEIFKYCSTPDCSQVYRATAASQYLNCPSCFAEVCTACHDEGHPGMTCAERRVHKDPGEQERLLEAWAVENNAKRCPSCRAFVEKTEGCNHMSCKCGVHFCWICMGIFDAGRIYDHMSQAHGGFYHNPEPRLRQPAAAVAPGRVQVPDIVQVVGGPAAVAAQMAEFRRIELQRAAGYAAPIRLVAPPAHHPLGPQAAEPDWIRVLQRQREVAAAERRRQEAAELERQRVQREAVEIERRRVLREAELAQARRLEYEVRRQQTEENKGWCTIM